MVVGVLKIDLRFYGVQSLKQKTLATPSRTQSSTFRLPGLGCRGCLSGFAAKGCFGSVDDSSNRGTDQFGV